MSSAVEAKLGVLYINAQLTAPVQQMLQEIGHTQPLMPIQTDYSTAIITQKIIPKATNAIEMHYHWLHDHKQQQQFCFGDQENQTTWTTGPNTMLPPITN